jgi:ribonucleoside-diphosphate reductase alpha chain
MTPEVRARKAAQDALMRGDTAGPVAPAAPAETNGGNGGGGNGANGGNGHAKPKASQPGKTVAAAEALTDSPPVIPAKLVGLDLGPACSACGGMMQRTGSCYTCSSCGNNTGCG